jgi:ABC-2 type transport system ATP-binding protein
MAGTGTGGTVIRTEGITKLFGKRGEIRAVDDLTIEVHRGETFGLLGPNGSGKTTTIRILNGVIRPSSGRAWVNGFDVLTETEGVKLSTGLLAESPGMYEKLSPVEYLEFMGALYNVPKDILPRRIDQLLTLFKLGDRRDELMEGFSKGMKQKVLIAAAVIHDPPIIFLDEPTSALDPRASLMVKELIKDLAEKANKTIFVSSHILSLIDEVCDRMAIINQGRLIAIGSSLEIRSAAGASNLEEAFMRLTGGRDSEELLAWRGDDGS